MFVENHFRYFGLLLFIVHFRQIESILCYQCTDCPEPFNENYPYVTIVNNSNFLAQCTKTLMNMGEGRRLISKGTVFSCPIQSTVTDVQVLCCDRDYCNSTPQIHLSFSKISLLSIFSLLTFVFLR